MNKASIYSERLKNVLISDKHFNPERVKDILKSDIVKLIQNYADINSNSVYFDITVTESGLYHIHFEAISERLKIFGSLPE